MQVVIEQLRDAQVDEFRTVVMGFINSLVHGASGIDERCALRDELIGK